MALGIYKPGQGYWVRVMTATMIAVLFLAGAAWMFKQTQLVLEKMAPSAWTMGLSQAPSPAPTPGQSVTLADKPKGDDPAPKIGQAEVDSFDPASSELRIRNAHMTGTNTDPRVAFAVVFGTAPPISISKAAVPQASFDPLLVQGGVTMLVLILGAAIAWYGAAMSPRFVDFLIATDGEMKKVNWSTGKDIRMSTLVVIFAAVVLSATLFVVDFSFQEFFRLIGVLVH